MALSRVRTRIQNGLEDYRIPLYWFGFSLCLVVLVAYGALFISWRTLREDNGQLRQESACRSQTTAQFDSATGHVLDLQLAILQEVAEKQSSVDSLKRVPLVRSELLKAITARDESFAKCTEH
jgi:Tfp pilus assembly protein PilN